MSIQINTIRTHCTLCNDFTPLNEELFGFVAGSSTGDWWGSTNNCAGCQFLVAVISAADSMGISGDHKIVSIDGSQGSVPRFTVHFSDRESYFGSVEVGALNAIWILIQHIYEQLIRVMKSLNFRKQSRMWERYQKIHALLSR
jgi:hypothetical protein